eukprot:c32444_g1_i1.p1 GENE.c32444_g1_i1~~c32444_g1_i1.p1  ORF type:complete len:683 (+),score=150.73 c32444_g1_i1:122-2050(+)
MGDAPMAHVLWGRVMRYNPKNPFWTNRDRFVQSNGHGCALLYSMLHLTGYDQISMDQLKQFRQLGSLTAGHPENHLVDGIEVSTGPLGQGISNAVGLAIAEQQAAATFNRDGFNIVDNFTYVICGDGCMQEGVASEAASLAGHLGLGKLIVLYDDNKITIDGETSKSFSEDVLARFRAYGWHTQSVEDGNTDVDGIEAAIRNAQAVTDKPSLIAVHTIIGIGSKLQNTGEVHGSPLKADDLAQVKQLYGFNPEESFVIDPEVLAFYRSRGDLGGQAEAEWNNQFQAYAAQFPDLAREYQRRAQGLLPDGWHEKLPRYTPKDGAKATRQWSQSTLQALVDTVPEVVGGSADLQPSNGTQLNNYPPFTKAERAGRYLHFGVREHGMSAISNGIAAYGLNYIPFAATFLNFIEYGFGAVRVSAISHFRVIYIMTHDSIGLGEDGPTHQPVEANILVRATPNIFFFRPGDGNEVTGAYISALENKHTPSVLALSRQAMPNLQGSAPEKVALGAYILQDVENPQVILVGTGTELHLCVEAAKELGNARVVSMPCWELFEHQSAEYQDSVFLPGVPAVSIEAMSTSDWGRYTHAQIGVDIFGESGPGPAIMKKYGITKDNLVRKAQQVLSLFPAGSAPNLRTLRELRH